jgi:hypothetical protein
VSRAVGYIGLGVEVCVSGGVVETVMTAASGIKVAPAPSRPFGVVGGADEELGGSWFPDLGDRSPLRGILVTEAAPVLAAAAVRLAVFCGAWFFLFGCWFACAGLPPLFFLLPMGVMPALPGLFARPRRRNRILVPIRWDGTLLAVLKAMEGEGFCRLEGALGRPLPSIVAVKMWRSWCGKVAAEVEDGGLSGLWCDFVFSRGLPAMFSSVVFVRVRCVGVLVCGRVSVL